MTNRIPDDLDALIEAALGNEPMLAAPAHLHRRVVERVRIAHLHEQERARFRYTMATLAVSMLAVFGGAGFAIWFGSAGMTGTQGVSGGMGQYDYFMWYFRQSWAGYSGAYSMVSAVLLAGGTLLLGLIPLWRYTSRSH
jgi:hypothetical protein